MIRLKINLLKKLAGQSKKKNLVNINMGWENSPYCWS